MQSTKLDTHQRVISEKGKITSIWQNKNFLVLFITGTIMAFGGKVYELALPLLLYDLTKSPIVMSTMRGIEFLPNLFLAVFIGVLVDRTQKKRWSLWTIGLQSLILLLLYFFIEAGKLNLYFFYAAGFVLMTLNYAYFNARISMVKEVLPHELLTSANASFSFIHTFIGIMGPAITGMLLVFANKHVGLLVTAIAFLIAMLFLTGLQMVDTKHATHTNHKSTIWRDLTDGWYELRNNRPLWLITILVIFTNSTSGMVDTMVIFYAKDQIQLSSLQVGIVLSCTGLGGLIGSTMVSFWKRKIAIGKLLGIITLLEGVAFMTLVASVHQAFLSLSMFFIGYLTTISSVCIWTYRQESTRQSMIGRVSGITGSLFKLAMPFAIISAGWIADLSSPVMVFILAGATNVILFLIYILSPLWKIN